MMRREAVGIELGLRPDSSGEGLKESDWSQAVHGRAYPFRQMWVQGSQCMTQPSAELLEYCVGPLHLFPFLRLKCIHILSLCLKLWQVCQVANPTSTFSLSTFLERVSNNFVDWVFRGHHHLSIPPLAMCPILWKFQPQHITDSYKGNNLAQGLPCGPPGEATHMDSRLSVTPATASVQNYL